MSGERVRVVFELRPDADGWPPATSERLWAIRVGDARVKLDNVPFFVRGFAVGDVVRAVPDENGVLWAGPAVEYSDNCTIRVIPAEGGHEAGVRQAVLDAFAPLGVDGEGIGRFGMVALNVPGGVDLAAVKRLLVRGADEGRWHYEEGCVTSAWREAG